MAGVDLQEYREKIGDLEKKYKEASNRLIAAETRHETAMAALKAEFGVDSVDAAREKMQKMDGNIERLETNLKREIAEVKEALDVGAG